MAADASRSPRTPGIFVDGGETLVVEQMRVLASPWSLEMLVYRAQPHL
jgi:hypothetical protein